ncbi:hypothetical protein H0H87_011639 [Tephrocybe sp. NHM501043]|nr:hypothetical protein H0H87_011639 [Tephrocybe sp. NHM501043]
METIAQLKSKAIIDIIEPTVGAFTPLLEANRASIQEIPKKTFQYGPTDRHQLDVYYPITPSTTGKAQILVWIYGGGFVTGERQMPAPADLVYASVGSFFAHNGFIVIIPDYRLSPTTVFPGAAEDVRDATLWAIKNPQYLTSPTTPNPDTNSIFLMGHSAGAVHAFASLILPKSPESAVLLPSIAGLILHAGAHHLEDFDRKDPWYAIAAQHYSGEEGLIANSSIGLLRSASDDTIADLPRTLLVAAEWEPEWLLKSCDDFGEALEARTGKKVVRIVAKGHNHLSPNWAAGTGQGEEWAKEVIAWMRG